MVKSSYPPPPSMPGCETQPLATVTFSRGETVLQLLLFKTCVCLIKTLVLFFSKTTRRRQRRQRDGELSSQNRAPDPRFGLRMRSPAEVVNFLKNISQKQKNKRPVGGRAANVAGILHLKNVFVSKSM